MKMLLSFLLMVPAGIVTLIWLRHRHIKEPLRRPEVPKVASAETPVGEPQNVSSEPLANQKLLSFTQSWMVRTALI